MQLLSDQLINTIAEDIQGRFTSDGIVQNVVSAGFITYEDAGDFFVGSSKKSRTISALRSAAAWHDAQRQIDFARGLYGNQKLPSGIDEQLFRLENDASEPNASTMPDLSCPRQRQRPTPPTPARLPVSRVESVPVSFSAGLGAQSKRFSERTGVMRGPQIPQVGLMNSHLRTALWNVVGPGLMGMLKSPYSGRSVIDLWTVVLRQSIDDMPETIESLYSALLSYYKGSEWFEMYDLVEYLADKIPLKHSGEDEYVTAINRALERENAGYRFVNREIVPALAEVELDSVKDSLSLEGPFESARAHIARALSLMSDRREPDYRNSIKEAVLALEAGARTLTGNQKATLGDAVKHLEREGRLHPAFKRAIGAIYGYSSDEGGIRHALVEGSNCGPAEAQFFVVACSAFLNYLVKLPNSPC